jgi:hypothetical protein
VSKVDQPGAAASRPVPLAWLPVNVQAIVRDGQAAPGEFSPAQQRPDTFAWMSDDSYALVIDAGTGVNFRGDSLVMVAITAVPGAAGRSAYWEIGWTSAKGEQHAFFESVGRSLFPGLASGFADDFISTSRLLQRLPSAADRDHPSWLGKPGTDQVGPNPPELGRPRARRAFGLRRH